MQRKRRSVCIITQIQKILDEKTCDPQLNVNRLARLVGVTTQHVYQLIYSYYRENPKKVIESCRLARAIDLMIQNPSINLYLVASEAGFTNYKALNRCFKKRLQISPSDFMALPTQFRPSIKLNLGKPLLNSTGPTRPEMRDLTANLQNRKRPRTLITKRPG